MKLDLFFTREYLKAGLLVSLLSVWVLVGLFFYLNRHTKRRYFTIWAAAWLFYALWMSLKFGVQAGPAGPFLSMVQLWCVGVSAVFLLWGSLRFLGYRVRQGLLTWFLLFLMAWSYIGAYHMDHPLKLQVPVFTLIGAASIVTAWTFLQYRRRREYIGATLLAFGFLLWGSYMAGYPFLESSEDLRSLALFISAALQLFVAVSMIILVLEEARHTHQLALQQVHSRKLEQESLQSRVESTEERSRALFDQASEAIVLTSSDELRILKLNRAAERLLGVTMEEACRHSLTAFCQVKSPAATPPQTGGEWFQAICQQRPLNLVRKNGGMAPVEVDGAPVELEGEPAYQFFLREITERARLEQQLRQAEKLSALGQMISGIAHELNNPLAVIKGYLDLVLSHHELSPRTRADLEKVARESNRAAKLVGNFLSFAREQPARREFVDLNKLIERVMDLRKFDIRVAGVDAALQLDPQLPQISADSDQIQQLLINLLNNALHAMVESSDPGRLTITTRTKGDLVQVLVEDNGPGVPAELEARIFEPFFTTKEVGTGTGLGLSIAHSIMTEHGGRIFYQRSSWGGAGFVLEFPVIRTALRARTESGSTPPFRIEPAAPCTGHILVLDDEPGIAEMLGEMLGLLGYTPTLCQSAPQALTLLAAHEFDLILSDFRMPGMNGREFYEAVLKKEPALARRIVFLTGDLVNQETQDFLKSTGNPHLAKPFQLAQVRKTIAEVMQPGPALEATPGES